MLQKINFFSRYGKLVASNPWWAILGCFVIAGLSAIGLLEYRTENNAFKLWIPDNSEFLENYNFLQEKFPPDTRFNNFIVAADNVLTPDVIRLVRNIFFLIGQIYKSFVDFVRFHLIALKSSTTKNCNLSIHPQF